MEPAGRKQTRVRPGPPGGPQLVLVPAGVHAHVLHPHRRRGGAAVRQRAEVHPGGDQLEASGGAPGPEPAPSPHGPLRQELEGGGVRRSEVRSKAPGDVLYLVVGRRADAGAEHAERQPDSGLPGLPRHVLVDRPVASGRGLRSPAHWRKQAQRPRHRRRAEERLPNTPTHLTSAWPRPAATFQPRAPFPQPDYGHRRT